MAKDLFAKLSENRRMCSRCVLCESLPDITLDAEGVCNICRQHETRRASPDRERPPLETDFVKILNMHKGKHRYDCMVMCSGGKDSTASLYYMVRRYKLKVLAFMFDHGFETEEAISNVRNAVERLECDFIFFRSSEMKGMFKRMVAERTRAVICHPCSMWYMDLAFDMATRHDVPIIIAGWTKGQSTRQEVMSKCACTVGAPEYQAMGTATRDFLGSLDDDPKYEDFPRSMEDVLKRARKKTKAMVLSPHWFLDTDPEEYIALISAELGWKAPVESYPSRTTNCSMNFISAYLTMKHYGFTHYHVESSKLIRMGLLSREQALKDLAMPFDMDYLNSIAARVGVKLED